MEGKSIFPEFDLGIADKAKKVGRFLGHLIAHRPTHAPLHMSNHYRGAAEMLDSYLQPQLPFEPSDGEAADALYVQQLVQDAKQHHVVTEGFDSEGTYIFKQDIEG